MTHLSNISVGQAHLHWIQISAALRRQSVLRSPSALDSCSPSRTVSRDTLCGIPSFLLAGLSFVAVSLLTNSSRSSFCARVRPMASICALPDAPASVVLKSMSFNRLTVFSVNPIFWSFPSSEVFFGGILCKIKILARVTEKRQQNLPAWQSQEQWREQPNRFEQPAASQSGHSVPSHDSRADKRWQPNLLV